MAGDVVNERGRRAPTALLLAIMALGPIPVHGSVALSPLLVGEIGLAEENFGLMVGLAFGVAALVSVPAGFLSDRLGGRSLVLAIGVLTTGALLMAGLALSIAVLILAVTIAGVTLGMSNPATNTVVAATADPIHRPRAVGIKQTGVPLAILTAGALPLLAELTGVSGAFLAVTALAGAVTFWALMTPMGSAPPRVERSARARVPFLGVAPLMVISLSAGAMGQGTSAYLPLFAHNQLGMAAALAGSTIAIVGLLGILGRIWWAQAYTRFARSRVLPGIAALGTLASVMLLASTAEISVLYWIGLVLHGFCTLAMPSVMFLAAMDLVEPAAVGRVSGYVSLCQFGGFAVGPALMGLAIAAGGYELGWSMVIVFGLIATTTSVLVSRRRGPHVGGGS